MRIIRCITHISFLIQRFLQPVLRPNLIFGRSDIAVCQQRTLSNEGSLNISPVAYDRCNEEIVLQYDVFANFPSDAVI